MKERGYPEVLDLQDLTTANGISRAYRYVSPESGVRQDTATTYLHPRLQDGNHPNLHVLVESQVSRILLNENKKATGVEYRSNPKLEGQENEDATHTVKSRKLVIISAGNIATPSILERSGIGSPDVLQKAGVPILYNLPGVGNGLQDHQMMIYSYKSGLEPGDTFDCFLDGTRDVAQALASHDKMLSWNGLDASAKIRPTQSEVDSMGPQFRKAWDRDFEDSPNRPLALLFPLAG